MNGDISLGIRPIQQFLAKHHAVLFICFIAILLSIAIYALYDISRQAEASSDSLTASTIAKFDQATIDKIKNLHSSTDTSQPLVFPSTRFNPFTE